MGGSSGQATSTQQFKPPDYTQAQWQSYIDRGYGLSQQPYQQYGGQQIADQSGFTGEAQNLIEDRALYGAGDLNAGRGAAANVASGAFFNNSPWTSPEYVNNAIAQNAGSMAQASALGAKAQTDSMFARSGGYGGSGWQNQQQQNQATLDNSVGQMANNYRLQNQQMGNQNYMTGINQMLQGGQLGGQLSQDDWQAGQALSGLGQQDQAQQQAQLSNQYANWQQMMNQPYAMQGLLGNYLANASGNYGTTTNTPYGSGGGSATANSLLGLGSLGLGAYQSGMFGS